jgi:predicted aspartyl protease
MQTFLYDTSYDPSAPVAMIGIGPSDGTPPRLTSPALLDTGADGTMIPLDMIRRAGGRYVQQRAMRGVTGEVLTVNLYLVAIHVDDKPIYGIRAVAAQTGAEVIVGRDVLNQLTALLDGKAQVLTINP